MLILDHANRVPTLRLLSPGGRLLCFRDTVSNTLCLESVPSLAEIDAAEK
jgi:hypothetical protein